MPAQLPKNLFLPIIWICLLSAGCNLVPDIRHKEQFHNPFPQLHRVAILPFSNQSDDPTLSGSRVSLAYYNELQSIPGFEVIPLGVVESKLITFQQDELKRDLAFLEDFQRFARYLGVDAVLQGAITDYESYYPPRMTLKVNWYAAHPGYHPIPAGYGLPWGTKKEKKIKSWIRLEAERELAKEQLKSQTPELGNTPLPELAARSRPSLASQIQLPEEAPSPTAESSKEMSSPEKDGRNGISRGRDSQEVIEIDEIPTASHVPIDQDTHLASALPSEWPDPQGFIPPAPSTQRPALNAQSEPIISHMKAYNGNDEDFTEMLSEYYYFRDDVRTGGWKSYLQRSEDFIRFCCHLHVTETLAARGGQLESRMILRWPIDRYER